MKTRCIRPLPRTAAEALSQLHRACFPDEAWSAADLSVILADPASFGRIGWECETPVGFVLVRDLGSEGEILSFGVIPERRRTGWGRALLDSAVVEARERNLGFVVLEVSIDNAAARGLYAQRGFQAVGRRRGYYRRGSVLTDALILRRPI